MPSTYNNSFSISAIAFDQSNKIYVSGYLFETYNAGFYTRVLTLTTPPPVVNSAITYCLNEISLPLSAVGINLKWYEDSVNDLPLSSPPVPVTTIADTVYYYVSQTIDGTESPMAKVQVIVHSRPDQPLVASPVMYCQHEIASPLPVSGIGLKWYTSINSSTALTEVPTPSTLQYGSTSYFVSQTIDGCESSLSEVVVEVKEVPLVNITSSCKSVSGSIQICKGEVLMLTASNADTYKWSTRESTQSISINTAGIYNVEVTYPNHCKSSSQMDVSIVTPPVVSLGNDTTLCDGTSQTINLVIPNASFLWSDGSTNSSYTIREAGSYTVSVTAMPCPVVKDTIQVNYISKIGYNIPNLITYNHDGFNESFTIPELIPNSEVELYNSWGVIIFNSKNYQNNWVPENESAGVYYYSVSNANTCVDDYKGWLQIIK